MEMEEGETRMKKVEFTTGNCYQVCAALANHPGNEDFEFTLDIYSDECGTVAQNSNSRFIASYLSSVADENCGTFFVRFENSEDKFYVQEKKEMVATRIRQIYRRYFSDESRGVLCWDLYQSFLKEEAREVWHAIGLEDAAEKLGELVYFQITGKDSPPENAVEERWAEIIKKELDGFSFNEVFDRAEEIFVENFTDACDGMNYTSQARSAMFAAYNEMLHVERN